MADTCIICGSPATTRWDEGRSYGCDCVRCGRWSVDTSKARLEQSLRRLAKHGQPLASTMVSRLSHIIRQQQTDDADRYAALPESLDAWHLQEALPSPSEQLDSLIVLVGNAQPSPDSLAILEAEMASAFIGAAINPGTPYAGLAWLIQQAIPEQLFDRSGSMVRPALRLTLKGWNRYAAVKRGQVESRTVLMAMKFGMPETDDLVTNCFTPAVARAGFELRTIVDKQPAGLIDDQLRVALRRSRFVIADLTHGNQGAYWESGFAEGLGRPVIYTCRAKEWGEGVSHFDTKHLVTIVWEPEKLDLAGEKLTATIRATLPEEAVMDDPPD